MMFGRVARKEYMCVIGISDASYHQNNLIIQNRAKVKRREANQIKKKSQIIKKKLI